MSKAARLFIGVPVPGQFGEALQRLQPQADDRARPVAPAQMHLTLHFIGQADPEPIAQALRATAGAPFSLTLDRLGAFGGPRRGGILWVGMEDTPDLSQLHQRTGQTLEEFGLELESRNFTPHITLARCRRGTPRSAFDDFLAQPLPALPAFPVSEFVLYSSRPTPEGSIYTPESSYPLE